MTTEKEKFVYETLHKIDNKQELSEEDIEYLIFDYSIDSIDIEQNRWTMTKKTIIKLNGRTFAVEWEEALTESNSDRFWSQLPIEVEQGEQVVKVWKPIK